MLFGKTLKNVGPKKIKDTPLMLHSGSTLSFKGSQANSIAVVDVLVHNQQGTCELIKIDS